MAQNNDVLINDRIEEMEVRVIGSHGEQIGIMQTSKALQLAEEEELDLVLIAPMAKPPVCKIIDYSKFRYEQVRKEKETRKKQKIVETKEIRFSPNIDTNDMNTKANAARKFILHGDKVKVSMRFRGREISHMQQRAHVLDEFAEKLADIAVVDKGSKVEGRCLVMFLVPKK